MGQSSIYPVTAFPAAVPCTLSCYDLPTIFCPDTPIPFLAVLGDSQAGSGNTLRVSAYDMNNNWDAVANSPPLSEQPSQLSSVYSLSYNKDGTRLAATHTRDGGISVWNTLYWTNINVPDLYYDATPPNAAVPRYGTFNHDDSQFLVCYTDAQAGPLPYWSWYQLYDIVGGTWTLTPSMDTLFLGDASHPNPAAYTWQAAYSPDGLYVSVPFIGGNPEFRVYNASNYAGIYILDTQPDVTATNPAIGAWGTAWHPSLPSRWVAFTSSKAPGLFVYEVNQINPDPPNIWFLISLGPSFVPTADGVQNGRCAFSPDGNYFAYSSQDAPYLYVYDCSTINNWIPVTLPSNPDGPITDVAFDKNTEWLLACKPSGSIPHGYAYEINNGWDLNTNTDLTQSQLAWHSGQIPEQ